MPDPSQAEVTPLPPGRDAEFRAWLEKNNVHDLDNPNSHYDYRGAFLAGEGRGAGSGHFTDRFKQHGHPTFSIESQYSKNSNDGGSWDGEVFHPAVTPKAPDYAALDAAYARQNMGDASYKNIDFERMLSDLGAALERNKAQANPGSMPSNMLDRTAPAAPAVMSPRDAQTSRELDAVQTTAPNGVPFGSSPAPQKPAYSPQDLQTLAELNSIQTTGPNGIPYGTMAPSPAHAPPPAIAAQLAGIANQPTAASAPPTVYPVPTAPPVPDDGLAAYASRGQ